MSKYIIELNDDCNMVLQICITEHGSTYIESAYAENLEELNSDYINEHYGELQDEAYDKGYAQCQDDYGDALKHAKDTAYQKGLEDGKAVNDKGCEGCMYQDNTIEHHPCGVCRNAYNNRWKAKDDKIKVGDEVNWIGDCFIVTRIFQPRTQKEQCDGIDDDGCVYHDVLMDDLEKTGRHFDIASILEGMKHD